MDNDFRLSTLDPQSLLKPTPSLHDGSLFYTETTTRMEQLNFVNKWAVEQFSVQQELCPSGESIEGSIFGSGPYKFQMRLFPSGKDEECSGFLSLYLLIKDCPGPRVSFRVNFSIDTLDGPRGCALNKSVVTINRGGIVTASKFFALDTLKTRGNRFLPNDSLVVSVELVVYGELKNNKNELDGSDLEDDSPTPAEMIGRGSGGGGGSGGGVGGESSNESRTSLLSFPIDRKRKSVAGELSQLGKPVPEDEYEGGFASLINSGELSDFVIECANKHEIKAHRAILYARSGYFQGIFRSNLMEAEKGRVRIDDVDADVLEACIKYMYTLQCPQLLTIPSKIARAADRLIMPGLKSRCESILSVDLSPHNVADRLKVAYELNMQKLHKKTTSYFARNREAVFDSAEWKDLKKSYPELSSKVMEDAWKVAERHRYPSVKRRRASEDV